MNICIFILRSHDTSHDRLAMKAAVSLIFIVLFISLLLSHAADSYEFKRYPYRKKQRFVSWHDMIKEKKVKLYSTVKALYCAYIYLAIIHPSSSTALNRKGRFDRWVSLVPMNRSVAKSPASSRSCAYASVCPTSASMSCTPTTGLVGCGLIQVGVD